MRNTQIVLAFMLTVSIIRSEEIVINNNRTSINVLSSSDYQITIQCNISRFDRKPITIDGEAFYQLSLADEATTFEKGCPELPTITRSIIIPNNAKMQIEVIESNFVERKMMIAPSKGLLTSCVKPDDVPYEFSGVYDLNEFYPHTIADLGTPYILRDFRGSVITIYPFAYNPQTQTLRIYTHLILAINNIGPGEVNTKLRNNKRYNTHFSSIYRNHFINFDNRLYDPVDERGRMIVICHGTFMDAIGPYVDWKNQKGIQTDLYDVSTIGSDSIAIKNFILSEYNANDGLVFVQLVGDAAFVPTFITDTIFFGIHGSSDATYSLLEGDDTYPDIFVGRFSAENIAQLQTQIERTIHYERDIAGGDWLHKGTCLATVWGEGYGHNGWSGVQSERVIRQKLLNYTYSEVDTLFEQGEPPFNIIPVEAWQVTEVLNEGRGILCVDGNADTIYLDTGQYLTAHVDALVNDYQLPFVHFTAPYMGRFHGTCLAEAWLRATNDSTGAPTGAIAVYTCSNALMYAPPQAAMHETIDLLTNNQKNSFGGLMYNGACGMMDIYGAPDDFQTFVNFNILGDASLQVRTDTPESLIIVHDSTISVGQTSFDVSAGVEDILVCLSHEYEIIAADYTDVTGNVTLIFNPPTEPADYILTATGYNKTTNIDSIPVVLHVDETRILSPSVTILSNNYPNPFDHATSITFELTTSQKVLIEVYDILGKQHNILINKKMEAGRHTVKWNAKDAYGRDMPSGVYFYRFITKDFESIRKMLLVR